MAADQQLLLNYTGDVVYVNVHGTIMDLISEEGDIPAEKTGVILLVNKEDMTDHHERTDLIAAESHAINNGVAHVASFVGKVKGSILGIPINELTI